MNEADVINRKLYLIQVNNRLVIDYVEEFFKLVKTYQGRQDRVCVTIFDSFLTPKAEVKKSVIEGKGIFTNKHIKKGELIAVWGGHLLNKFAVKDLSRRLQDYHVQVWHDLFLGPTCEDDVEIVDYMNHSCEPNCGVNNSILVVARRDILPDEELTFDYSTTDTMDGHFFCKCNTPNCRGEVTGQEWMTESFRFKYYGFISDYILEIPQQST